MIDRADNPFLSRAKSNDLRNDEVQRLWISYEEQPEHPGFDPKSPMATIVLGGKGSGKSHLFRYFSFPVQGLRYGGDDWAEGVQTDGYVGVYARAEGLQARRFAEKGITDEHWREVYQYYVELWLADAFVRVVKDLGRHVSDVQETEADIVSQFWDCLDATAESGRDSTFESFGDYLATHRRNLDRLVNVAAFENSIAPNIICGPGRLVFGLPRVLARSVSCLHDVLFCYYIDECETLLKYQQRHINTLVRDRSEPTTFRIGARSYGLRTHETDSGDYEEIRDGSEFCLLQLDAHYRREPKRYAKFARRLLDRRLEADTPALAKTNEVAKWFVHPAETRPAVRSVDPLHLRRLRSQVESIAPAQADLVIDRLRCPTDVIVEKAAIFRFYQAVAKGRSDLPSVAANVVAEIEDHLAGRRNKLSSAVEHYKGDFAAQLRRDRQGGAADDLGLDNFIAMSEGLPRILLTLVGNVVRCAAFRGELPMGAGSVSLDSQRQGVRDSGERFYSDIPRAGENGDLIQLSIARLGELFRINRFAHKPIECSLISFSVRLDRLPKRAQAVIREAEQRSFLVRREPQKDRSTMQIWEKFHLNRLLCPKYELGIAVRGTARFSVELADAVFGQTEEGPFQDQRRQWRAAREWPFGRERRGVSRRLIDQ